MVPKLITGGLMREMLRQPWSLAEGPLEKAIAQHRWRQRPDRYCRTPNFEQNRDIRLEDVDTAFSGCVFSYCDSTTSCNGGSREAKKKCYLGVCCFLSDTYSFSEQEFIDALQVACSSCPINYTAYDDPNNGWSGRCCISLSDHMATTYHAIFGWDVLILLSSMSKGRLIWI
nr:uncharacterized protein LOC127293932 isoform X3 [Lolium perenne]